MKQLALLLALSSCGTSGPGTASGDTIHVKLQESFEVKMGVVMASGSSWWLADSAYQSYLVLDTTYTIANPSDLEGDPETQVFKFTGSVKGKTTLHFKHGRPWRKTDPPDKEKFYRVIVE